MKETDACAALTESLRTLQEKAKMQDSAVTEFQELIRQEGSFSRITNRIPYPLAVFSHDGALVFVNEALSEETGLYYDDLAKGRHNIIDRITDRNFQILDAVEQVFAGATTFLNGLFDPLDLFLNDASGKTVSSPDYRSAIIFPLVEEAGQITRGAAVFLKLA